MGREISFITKHNFPVHDIDLLMEDLANRFNANVFFIFPSFINLDKYLENINLYDLQHNIEIKGYVFKKFIKDSKLPNLTISDEDFMYRYFRITFGEQAGDLPEFMKYWSNNTEANNRIIDSFVDEYQIFDVSFQDFSISIFKESAEIRNDYYQSGWWDMFRLLFKNQTNYFKDFLDFRNRNIEIAHIIGGDSGFYFDDQGHAKIAQGNAWEMTWEEIDKVVHSGFTGENMIDLVKVITDKEYNTKYTQLCNKKPHDYSIFKDDFSEIVLSNVVLKVEK